MNDGSGCAIVLLVCVVSFLSAFITGCVYENEPQAIEVYQGKTTLEYTIRDGEIVDSVVVFKNK